MSSTSPTGIFVYGTLRSDIEQHLVSDYNKIFNKNCVSKHATLYNASMYFDGYYPFVVIDDAAKTIYGLFVIPNESIDDKIKEADKIEGNLYERCIINITISETNEIVNAYIYIKSKIHISDVIKLSSGNWLDYDKNTLVLEYLSTKYPEKDKSFLQKIIERSSGDIRLANSLIKWNC